MKHELSSMGLRSLRLEDLKPESVSIGKSTEAIELSDFHYVPLSILLIVVQFVINMVLSVGFSLYIIGKRFQWFVKVIGDPDFPFRGIGN